jgi:hypothetical protein
LNLPTGRSDDVKDARRTAVCLRSLVELNFASGRG